MGADDKTTLVCSSDESDSDPDASDLEANGIESIGRRSKRKKKKKKHYPIDESEEELTDFKQSDESDDERPLRELQKEKSQILLEKRTVKYMHLLDFNKERINCIDKFYDV